MPNESVKAKFKGEMRKVNMNEEGNICEDDRKKYVSEKAEYERGRGV